MRDVDEVEFRDNEQLLVIKLLTAEDPSLAGEAGVLYGGEDGVVHAGLAGNGVPQPLQGIVAGVLDGPREAQQSCEERRGDQIEETTPKRKKTRRRRRREEGRGKRSFPSDGAKRGDVSLPAFPARGGGKSAPRAVWHTRQEGGI